MKKTVFIGAALCLLPAAVAAQQSPDTGAAQQQEARGTPANICHELVAFLQPKPQAHSASPQAAGQAAQGQGAPAPQAAGQPTQPPQASGQSGSAQQASGQSGVGPEAPKPNAPQQASGSNAPQTSGQSAPVPQGSGQNAPQTSGQSAPVPQGSAKSTPAETAVTLEQAQAMAEANDVQGCRDATQRMRRAGVALPPALIALAALDPQYLQAAPQSR